MVYLSPEILSCIMNYTDNDFFNHQYEHTNTFQSWDEPLDYKHIINTFDRYQCIRCGKIENRLMDKTEYDQQIFKEIFGFNWTSCGYP
jgi:hypothetical protein